MLVLFYSWLSGTFAFVDRTNPTEFHINCNSFLVVLTNVKNWLTHTNTHTHSHRETPTHITHTTIARFIYKYTHTHTHTETHTHTHTHAHTHTHTQTHIHTDKHKQTQKHCYNARHHPLFMRELVRQMCLNAKSLLAHYLSTADPVLSVS